MVFPEAHCMARLFTPKIANYYEEYYKSKGVNFVKGTVLSSFEIDTDGKVTAVILKDGTHLPAALLVSVGLAFHQANQTRVDSVASVIFGLKSFEKQGLKDKKIRYSNSLGLSSGGNPAPLAANDSTNRLEAPSINPITSLLLLLSLISSQFEALSSKLEHLTTPLENFLLQIP
ncbi:hypothetical protein F8388_011209 [Cannabis sativa]|uniref:Pyridine nucleotide-disulphide oxidoreductase N-terminal domain-containing protein n=1 Tax=Cannabis sativa TaxID=3483 RepID=A0A7J6ES48_CANSA|nr:hypothetical protein F8388_011209 [Cannabis sativa]